MSALHLLWIIPLSAMCGFVFCALVSANEQEEKEDPRMHPDL